MGSLIKFGGPQVLRAPHLNGDCISVSNHVGDSVTVSPLRAAVQRHTMARGMLFIWASADIRGAVEVV